MLIFEGADYLGKTHFAKRAAELLGRPYLHFGSELSGMTGDEWVDHLVGLPEGAIVDRHFLSEWVYGKILRRETDLAEMKLSQVAMFAEHALTKADARMIIFTSPTGRYKDVSEALTREEYTDHECRQLANQHFRAFCAYLSRARTLSSWAPLCTSFEVWPPVDDEPDCYTWHSPECIDALIRFWTGATP